MERFPLNEDLAVAVDLYVGGQPKILAGNEPVLLALVKPDRTARATGTSDVTGGIVSNGSATVPARVTATIPAAAQSAVTAGTYLVEFRVGGQTYDAPTIELYARRVGT